MKIIIQSPNLPLTRAIKQFSAKHCQRLFAKGMPITQVTLFLDHLKKKKNDDHANKAKIQVSTKGKDVIVERRAADLYQAIIAAAKSAARAIRKKKEKSMKY